MEEPDRLNSRFSEPMKIFTPWPCVASSSNRISSFLRSMSSNSMRMRERSVCASTESSRCDVPRTISTFSSSLLSGCGATESVAKPSATIFAVSLSSSARSPSSSPRISSRAEPSVRPRSLAFR